MSSIQPPVAPFANLSIRHKIALSIMLTSSVAVLLACAAFVIFSTIKARDAMVRNLSIMADVVGSKSAAAMVFEDSGNAEKVLGALHVAPSIISAGIFSGDGALFAAYRRNAESGAISPPTQPGDGHHFGDNALLVFRPIMLDDERIGTLYIQSDLREMTAHLMMYGSIGVLVFLSTLLAAFILSWAIQRIISEPISRLARTMSQVTDEQNYALRAAPPSWRDEMSALALGFNDMLAQIEKRDVALQQANNQLEDRVADRTRDLQQEMTERVRLQDSLLQAQKMESVGQLAGGIAHEFNNLLQAILGHAEVSVLRLPPDHPVHNNIENIAKAAQKAAVLTARLLAFGRRSILCPRELNLGDLARHVAALFQHTCDPRIHIETVVPQNLWSVQADHDQIQQALTHLCRNACECMPDGGRLTLGLENRLQGDLAQVRVTVTDTGVGMDAATCERVFEPFFTTKGVGEGVVGKGTGLGLAMVHGIVVQHGGSIVVESRIGQGSRFTIDLPRDLPRGMDLPPA